jgi:hypothetical protein
VALKLARNTKEVNVTFVVALPDYSFSQKVKNVNLLSTLLVQRIDDRVSQICGTFL